MDDIPDDVAEALQKDVDKRGVSLTDAIVKILAKRYKLPYTPTNKPSRTRIDSNRLIIKIPEDIWFEVRINAARSGGSMRGVVIYALQQHYKLGPKLPETAKHGRSYPLEGSQDADLHSARS